MGRLPMTFGRLAWIALFVLGAAGGAAQAQQPVAGAPVPNLPPTPAATAPAAGSKQMTPSQLRDAVKRITRENAAATALPDKMNPFPHYADKSRGWHFKEPIPEEEVPEDPPPPSPLPPAPPSKEEPAGPKPLSTQWLRESIPKYLDAAIEDPTPQNISNYLYLQKFAMDASERFAQNYRRVVYTDPNLDESAASPTWTGGSQAMAGASDTAKKELIRSLNKDFAIWFFFRSDCQPCHIQAPVVEALARMYGFSVLAISVDGAPLRNSPFQKYVVDTGQAAKLGIDGTPTTVLVRPPNVVVPVSYGMSALPELESRIIEAAAQMGAITEKQYASTRPERKRFLPSPQDAGSSPGRFDPSDPKSVRDYLKSLVRAPQQ